MSEQSAREPYRATAPGAFEGEYVLCPAPERRWIAGAPISGLAGLTAIVLTKHAGGMHDGLLFGLFVASVLALFGVAHYWRTSVTVNGRELAWGRGKVSWEDVASVRFAWGRFLVESETGERLSVGVRWSHIDAFARAVLARVSSERIADARTRAMLETLCVPRARRFSTATHIDGAQARAGATSMAIARWRENPFFILGVAPDCSRAEAERAGERLLALLAVGASAAKTYLTPFGAQERMPERVRSALAELRDPSRRLVHEVWARTSIDDPAARLEPATRPWKEAMRAAGWRDP